MLLQLEEKSKKRRKKKVLWRGEKEEKEQKKKKREVMMLSARCGQKKKKKRINLVYLGLDYFGAIFCFFLRCWLGIGGCKMEGLHLHLTKVKLFF
jgi:hypothetical protein